MDEGRMQPRGLDKRVHGLIQLQVGPCLGITPSHRLPDTPAHRPLCLALQTAPVVMGPCTREARQVALAALLGVARTSALCRLAQWGDR